MAPERATSSQANAHREVSRCGMRLKAKLFLRRWSRTPAWKSALKSSNGQTSKPAVFAQKFHPTDS